jgi:hypothetical protein
MHSGAADDPAGGCREGGKRVWFTDHSDCRRTDELAIPPGVTLEGLGYLTSRITLEARLLLCQFDQYLPTIPGLGSAPSTAISAEVKDIRRFTDLA